MDTPSEDRIDAAGLAGAGIVVRTPIVESPGLSERTGGIIVLKAENLQRTGSFKLRGALARLAELGADDRARGVVAGSAGNHGQSLAYAAKVAGIACQVFVPRGASIAKCEAIRSHGASVSEAGDSVDDAVAAARDRAAETGATFVSPYDDLAIIAGQATLGRELVADIPGLRRVVVPLGGGGLISGVALAVKRHDPSIRVIGVQVASCAPYANQPVADGPVATLADGIAVKRPGALTKPIVDQYVDDIVTVTEDEVGDAMVYLMERSHLYVEGGGAVGVAALLSGDTVPARSGVTCVVLSGGNVDLGTIPALIRRHETRAGRRVILYARISDRPGALARLLTLIGEQGGNLVEVEHVREGVELHVRETGVQIVTEVRDRAHALTIVAAARASGHDVGELQPR